MHTVPHSGECLKFLSSRHLQNLQIRPRRAKRSLAHGADINDLQTQKDNVSMNFDVDQAEEVSNCIWATINIWYLAPSRQFLVNVCLFSKFRETVFVVLAFLVCSNVFLMVFDRMVSASD